MRAEACCSRESSTDRDAHVGMRNRALLALAAVVSALVMAPGASAMATSARTLASLSLQETLPPIDMSEAERCDFIADPGNPVCMLPFPDNYNTVADPTSATGLRVDFKSEGMPANAEHEHIEAEPYDAADGFSPGSVILVKIPGIQTAADVHAMGAVPINHIGPTRERTPPSSSSMRRRASAGRSGSRSIRPR